MSDSTGQPPPPPEQPPPKPGLSVWGVVLAILGSLILAAGIVAFLVGGCVGLVANVWFLFLVVALPTLAVGVGVLKWGLSLRKPS
jgi:hypothetical protein